MVMRKEIIMKHFFQEPEKSFFQNDEIGWIAKPGREYWAEEGQVSNHCWIYEHSNQCPCRKKV